MFGSNLLRGTLAKEMPLPISLSAALGDLRTRFLAKGQVGTGYRFIARNGRVLLATEGALAELLDRAVYIRIQVWHRAILPGDPPDPYGLLLCIRHSALDHAAALYRAALVETPAAHCALAIEVGGGRWLEFNHESGNNIRAKEAERRVT
jgi:hypothetical protein